MYLGVSTRKQRERRKVTRAGAAPAETTARHIYSKRKQEEEEGVSETGNERERGGEEEREEERVIKKMREWNLKSSIDMVFSLLHYLILILILVTPFLHFSHADQNILEHKMLTLVHSTV